MTKCRELDCNNDVEPRQHLCIECKKKIANNQYKNWYEKNKEKRTEYNKTYRKKNKERISARFKDYREIHRDDLNAHHKQWYQENLDREREKDSLFRRTTERRFYVAKRSAKKRKFNFSLTIDQYKYFISLPCYYCNNKLCDLIQTGSGLDRLDNSRGYEQDNVVSCGKICNSIKMDYLSVQETKAAVEAILKIRYPNDKYT